jgi:hypothetical protein
MQTATAPPAAPPARTTRVVPIVVGSIVALLSLMAGAVGGLALVANGEQDDRGYLSTGVERYAAGGHAIVADDLDIDDVPEFVADTDDFGKLRLQATSRGDEPVFVGVARSDDVEAYLSGAEHSTLTDVDYDPFRPEYREHEGSRTPAPPASQDIWATSTHGPGTQTLTWDVREGSWSIVVMNADGSAGVDTEVRAGVRVPWLDTVGWSALGSALVLMGISGVLILMGVRGPRR